MVNIAQTAHQTIVDLLIPLISMLINNSRFKHVIVDKSNSSIQFALNDQTCHCTLMLTALNLQIAFKSG